LAIRLNTNLAALDALFYLNRHTERAQNSIEHLSSGLRVMHAADDPGAISLTVRLKVEALGFEQSARNANEGATFIQMADSATAEIADVLGAIRGHALQAANGTMDSAARAGLSVTFTNLKSEIQRIVNTTKYGDIFMLKTTNSAGGTGSTGTVSTNLTLPGVKFALGPSADELRPFIFSTGVSSVEASLRGATTGTNSEVLQYGTMTSVSAAKSVLTAVDSAIRSISFFRGALGGSQSGLLAAAQADETTALNVTAALSGVQDLDFAAEVANFTQASILQQAAMAFLAGSWATNAP
jgi:flagellin